MAKLRGSTLVETLVALTITILVIGLTFSFFLNLLDQGSHERDINAQVHMDYLMKELIKGMPEKSLDLTRDGITFNVEQEYFQNQPELTATTIEAVVNKAVIQTIYEVHPTP